MAARSLDSGLVLPTKVLTAVAEAARWAPSILNTQPWRLRRLTDGLAVMEDPTRSLPILDPAGRDRVISCGAALLNARVALRASGYQVECVMLPEVEAEAPAPVGVVRAVAVEPASEGEALLCEMIAQRRTHRRVYRSNAVCEQDLIDLREAVCLEGARLWLSGRCTCGSLAHLLHQSVRHQAGNPRLREEVEAWVRRDDASAIDGVDIEALGIAPFPVDSLIHADHLGPGPLEDLEQELGRSTLLVITTPGDTPWDWMIAGMALERLLLTATAQGLVASFPDQAIQDPATRPHVAVVLGCDSYPQVMLRVGRTLQQMPRPARRPLTDLFA